MTTDDNATRADTRPTRRKRWARVLLRAGAVLLGVALTLLLYVALIMGEPNKEATEQTAKAPEERITHAIPSQKTTNAAGVATIAEAFGRPVVTLGERYAFVEGNVYDTAYEGGFARVASFQYALPSGGTAELRSVRPASAIKLLRGDGYRLNAATNAAMGGMSAVCMTGAAGTRYHAVQDDTLYLLTVPAQDAHDAPGVAASVRLVTLPAAP